MRLRGVSDRIPTRSATAPLISYTSGETWRRPYANVPNASVPARGRARHCRYYRRRDRSRGDRRDCHQYHHAIHARHTAIRLHSGRHPMSPLYPKRSELLQRHADCRSTNRMVPGLVGRDSLSRRNGHERRKPGRNAGRIVGTELPACAKTRMPCDDRHELLHRDSALTLGQSAWQTNPGSLPGQPTVRTPPRSALRCRSPARRVAVDRARLQARCCSSASRRAVSLPTCHTIQGR